MSKVTDLRDKIVAEIIANLENNNSFWRKDWSGAGSRPKNIVNNRAYSGLNAFWLSLMPFSVPHYLTVKQAIALGADFKGQKTTPVFLSMPQTKEEVKDGVKKTTTYWLTRVYNVLNVEQCSGLPEKFYDAGITLYNDKERIENCEKTVTNTGAKINHKLQDQAYYSPQLDHIVMPKFEQFHTVESYYSTLFHELSHWTGHESRLNRAQRNKFGSVEYAFEELVAEMSSAFICAEMQLKNNLQHSEYINGWIKLLTDKPNTIFKVANLATKAADFILNREDTVTDLSEAA